MNPLPAYIPSWLEYQASMVSTYSHALMDLSSTSSSSPNSSGATPQPNLTPLELQYQAPDFPRLQGITTQWNMQMNYPFPVVDPYFNPMLPSFAPILGSNYRSNVSPVNHMPPTPSLLTATSTNPTPSEEKSRRTRTYFSRDQLAKLEAEFKIRPNLDLTRKNNLAEEIGVTPKVVSIWFKNRRQKKRNQE